MRALSIFLSLVAMVVAGVVWLSTRPNRSITSTIVSPESQPVAAPVASAPAPTPEQEKPALPPSPPVPGPTPDSSVAPDVQASAAGGSAPTPDKGEKQPPVDDPETAKVVERLRKLQSDPTSRERLYQELQDSFDAIHNQQAIPVSEPPDPGQPRAGLSTYDDIFASLPARPVMKILPRVREQAGLQVVPVPRRASSTQNSKAYVRDLVVYWSKRNNAPVELSLAVAFQESGFALNPPRGAAGEIGPMQIMPERCRAEGYPPSKLWDPQFNIWLGTALLARYFAEEKSYARAAAKYVAGPGVFDRHYSKDLREYINAYAASVENYAKHFTQYS